MSTQPNNEFLIQVVERCRIGDQRAWTQLVDLFQRLVYSIPKRMGLSDDDAADVFQNTFTALYRNLDRIENGQTLPKWLAVTASRESLRLKRAQAARLQNDDQNLDQIVAEEESSAETNAISSVEKETLWRGVDILGGRCRDLVKALYAAEDVSYEEVSSKLGMPVGAIGPTRARCLKKLRKILQQSGTFRT